MWTYTCERRCACLWVHECGSGRTALGFIPQLLPTFFRGTGSLSGVQLAEEGGLTYQRAARVPHLCLPSAMPCFFMWFWRLNKLNCSGLYGSKPFTSTAMPQPACFCLLIWAFFGAVNRVNNHTPAWNACWTLLSMRKEMLRAPFASKQSLCRPPRRFPTYRWFQMLIRCNILDLSS